MKVNDFGFLGRPRWGQGVLAFVLVALLSGPDLRGEPLPAPEAGVGSVEMGAEAGPGWWEKLKTGGWVVGVQLALSVGAGAAALACWKLNRPARVVPEGLAEKLQGLAEAGKWEEVVREAGESDSVLGRLVVFLARHRTAPYAELNMTAGDMAASELSRLSQRAQPLLVIGTIETLLGLLGTILGMIAVFDVVAVAGELGDPGLMAGGISQALVTTAVGLILAIPMLAAHHYFQGRVKGMGAELSEQVTDLMTACFLSRKEEGDS